MARTRSTRTTRKRKAKALTGKGRKKAKSTSKKPLLDFRTTRAKASDLSWTGDAMDRKIFV